MAERHSRPYFYIANRDTVRGDVDRPGTASERAAAFKFSEMVQRGTPPDDDETLRLIARRMIANPPETDSDVPAGYTYLAQFVDHDLTRDVTRIAFGTPTTAAQLDQGRSPALDLDSLYGEGPTGASARFYDANGVTFRLGRTIGLNTPFGDIDLEGFDLPRAGAAAPSAEEARKAVIGDPRNDENLAVAQTHLAFLRFHNAMVKHLSNSTPSALLFEAARREVTLHYQWILRHDFLPRVIEPAILDDVFSHGRKVFEPGQSDTPTMPIEFSVAAYRFGHSMIRESYDWNQAFNDRGPPALGRGTLLNLFRFSGTSGNLNPDGDVNNPLEGNLERLVTIWVADWTRLFDFVKDGAPAALAPADGGTINHARRIDTRLADPLKDLPRGSFGPRNPGPTDPDALNLAFRNVVRGKMVKLATAQEVAAQFQAAGAASPFLTSAQIIGPGDNGVDLSDLPQATRDIISTATPLWFYILREAELNHGRLTGIGGRIAAETFHRAMEGSRTSILRLPAWRPLPGTHPGGFGMVDLLRRAYDGAAGELRPLSKNAPKAA